MTEATTFLMEYKNDYTDGAWKRTTFGHSARPIAPPKNFYEAQQALEGEALAWKHGTHLRIVEIHTTETEHAHVVAIGGLPERRRVSSQERTP